MGDLTRNLSRSEFACKCGCGFDTVDFDLPGVIQDVVDHFQDLNPEKTIGVTIISGCRCPEHNVAVGGSEKSRHIWGQAADHFLYDKKTGTHIEADEVADYLEAVYPVSKGIGRYRDRTHIDIRKAKARWDNR